MFAIFVEKFFFKRMQSTSTTKCTKKQELFSCHLCSDYFDSEENLLKHKLKFHDPTHPFECNTCYKTFYKKVSLERHSGTHSAERNYACATCGKSFKDKSNLKKHLLIHSGEKPFACKECTKAYSQSQDLKRHVEKHHRSNVMKSSTK